jgi:hypothetical protein
VAAVAAIALLALLVVPLLVLLARLVAGRSPPDGPAPATPRPPGHGTSADRTSRAWTAEIEWCDEDGVSRFRVVAIPPEGEGGVTLGASPRIEWPPRNAADVDSLVGAVTDLERAVVAAGWEPSDSGSSWYARRFVWPWTDRVPERTLDHARAGDRA